MMAWGPITVEGRTRAPGEAFINAPLSGNAAVRVVGWYRKDGGYIDNVPGTLVFPTVATQSLQRATLSNMEFVEEDYNDVDTYGARAALRIAQDERVPVRLYVPFGQAWLPYCVAQARQRPRTVLQPDLQVGEPSVVRDRDVVIPADLGTGGIPFAPPVGHGVAELVQVHAPAPHDVADALAVAICHLHNSTGAVAETLARHRAPRGPCEG